MEILKDTYMNWILARLHCRGNERDGRQKNKGSQSITIKSGKTRKKYEEIIKELEWDVRSTLTQRSTNIIKYTQQQQ